MRFLFSRRWVLFALAVGLMAYGCYLLGQWQFHRLHDREASNAQTTGNLAARPVPATDVMAVGRPLAQADEWRRVTATGSYDESKTVIVRYQTRDGQSGVDVVTPLVTTAGPRLLVDRGWMSTGNTGARPHVPPAPSGQVTIQGWVRIDAEGDAATVTDRSTRAISSVAIAPTVGGPVLGGFVDASKETPAPGTRLVPAELPDLGNGPHFFYGLQWWFFGVLAIFGFGYLAWDERRKSLAAATGDSGGEPQDRETERARA